MPRSGIEIKPAWKSIPKAIRQQVEAALGAQVVRAARVWGGYAPTPTFRLALADGRRAFFKGTNQESNEFMKNALRQEERVYKELAPRLGQWMPQFYAAFRHADWHVLILEDLGPVSVPPWTSGRTRAITHAVVDFHRASLDTQAPAWLPRPDEELSRFSWTHVEQETREFQYIAALAGSEAQQALAWLQQISPTIERLMQQPALREGPFAILHGDLRSDNLRFTRERLCLFDWPSICVGRPEWEVVPFAQSVAVDGGPCPEQVMRWYEERSPLRPEAVDCALVWWLTFFADRAWQPEIPGLPRVRRFQRQQLATLAFWAARRWSFPYPAWAERLLE
ncbi:MAG TPA: phosphotransferase [Ktedonobacteraceae bacterium]|jgi:fructosamine-3-kinase|nr:phosphotransferase [Ktedonobacteraceae bacterium]